MSRKTNYFKLGIFVIVAVALLLIGVFFLGAREMFRTEWFMETYLDHSVEGLNVGSPVKMMGVKIGAVKDIAFVYEEYETNHTYVRVIFSIDPLSLGAKRPQMEQDQLREAAQEQVERGLRLTLSSQGITGVSFLDAGFYDPDKITSLPIDWKPAYPYVPAVPGRLARLGSSLEKTLDNLAQVDFAGTMAEVKTTLAGITETLDRDIKPLVADLKPLVADLRDNLSPTLANIRTASADVPTVTARLNVTLQRLGDWISEQKGSMSEVIEDLRIISLNIKQLTESARRDPSSILFGEPPPPSKKTE